MKDTVKFSQLRSTFMNRRPPYTKKGKTKTTDFNIFIHQEITMPCERTVFAFGETANKLFKT